MSNIIVRVADVRKLRTPDQRATVIYVGRAFAGWKGHPLGNPFRPAAGYRPCLERYADWLAAHPQRAELFAAMRNEIAETGKPLGCWCVNWDGTGTPPMVCHAVVLAEAIKGERL